ncbi:MAG TPA: hypothetical protein VNX68_11285 [Nitrosopumilaceae archaeon]|jgi:hypothetical protein|nr:hypothetical protein [Nitrosopumilaceae archaeon]
MDSRQNKSWYNFNFSSKKDSRSGILRRIVGLMLVDTVYGVSEYERLECGHRGRLTSITSETAGVFAVKRAKGRMCMECRVLCNKTGRDIFRSGY